MEIEELIEFIGMLLVENKCNKDAEFHKYFVIHSNKDTFNNRYKVLLDKYINIYALDKTEKSD
jgi:hypothetical protein